MAKQAVVVIHGMGEQLPMETLLSFVDMAWANDPSLVDAGKPDPNAGGPRGRNVYWSKPDRRSRSFELRVITTETGKNRKRTDFYEFYWAHLMNDTTWEQVRAWVLELMLRNPFSKVPRPVLPVWILLWLIGIAAVAVGVIALRPGDDEGTWLGAIAATAGTAAVGWFISGFLVRYFGDVARYVRPKPANVARRQEIRESGVQLLESLMGVRADGSRETSAYDRVVVVAHSLGTIIAYDILTHAFARVNSITTQSAASPAAQDARVKLEAMIRDALKGAAPWDLDLFQNAQADAAAELAAAGSPWIVSDFVTLGSPLTHAEFLIVRDRAHLVRAKDQRILPSCPPTLEYDGETKLVHFTYRPPSLAKLGKDDDPAAPRLPHHAALFAYTRWTNIYSPHRLVVWGDLISGPVGAAFGLEKDGKLLRGVRDIAVMPQLDAGGMPVAGAVRPFFSHTRYWNEQPAGGGMPANHIKQLREAMKLGA